MHSPEPLEVRRLTKSFGGRHAVNDVSFSVQTGQLVGLLGPNGSGKSTALHCVTGLLSPNAGTIKIAGRSHDSPVAKDSFGFFPDDLPVPDALTSGETLDFHARLRPRFDSAFAIALLEVVGLVGHEYTYVGDFSHGMRRKFQLVLALAHRPRLLIFDEPLRGLDPEAGAVMNAVIKESLAGDASVLMATHDLHAAERLCDRVVVLSEGVVVADAPPDDLVRAAEARDLEEAFVIITGLRDRVDASREAVANLLNPVASTVVPTP